MKSLLQLRARLFPLQLRHHTSPAQGTILHVASRFNSGLKRVLCARKQRHIRSPHFYRYHSYHGLPQAPHCNRLSHAPIPRTTLPQPALPLFLKSLSEHFSSVGRLKGELEKSVAELEAKYDIALKRGNYDEIKTSAVALEEALSRSDAWDTDPKAAQRNMQRLAQLNSR